MKIKQKNWAIFLGLKDNFVSIIFFYADKQIFARRLVCTYEVIHADPERKISKGNFSDLDEKLRKACNFEYSYSLNESKERNIVERFPVQLYLGQKLLVLQSMKNLAYWATLVSVENHIAIVVYDGRTRKSKIWLSQVIHGISKCSAGNFLEPPHLPLYKPTYYHA